MELREIPVEDIYPDEKNPRKDFGDIAALAESCMLNALNAGEPVNPIVVVQDGGIYRIVDGERRYKAMKKNKLIRCHAVVCEDMDEANVMVAMVATDDKQQLSEVERSRGVQQMMLLGVDPESVEKAGRIPKGSFAKLRRARVAVNDAGDDMTLERMLAIAEFEEDGDDDAVMQLIDCEEGDWKWLASSIRHDREKDAKCDELTSICQEIGVELVDAAPNVADGISYRACGNDSETIGKAYRRLPVDTVGWICRDSYGGPEVRFYSSIEEKNVDPMEAIINERAHDIESMIASGNDRRRRWFAATIDDPDATPATRRFLALQFFSHSENDYQKEPGDLVVDFCKDVRPDGITYKTSGAFAAYLWERFAPKIDMRLLGRSITTGDLSNYEYRQLVEFLKLTSACTKDGWGDSPWAEPSDTELEESITSAIEKHASENEEEE